jgi:hypothetical protein
MSYMITMLNKVGVLDSKIAISPTDAAISAIEMIRDAGELYPGDRFIISEIDDGQTAILKARESA